LSVIEASGSGLLLHPEPIVHSPAIDTHKFVLLLSLAHFKIILMVQISSKETVTDVFCCLLFQYSISLQQRELKKKSRLVLRVVIVRASFLSLTGGE